MAEVTRRRRVLINLSSHVFAQIINRIAPIIVYAYAQRKLGNAAFGHALFACQLIDWTSPFIESGTGGLGQVRVGESHGEPHKIRALIGKLLSVRLLNAILVAMVFSWMVPRYYSDYQATILALGFILVCSALDLQYVQYGTQKVWALSTLNSIGRPISLGLVLVLVDSPADSTIFAVLLMAGNAILSLGSFVLATKHWRPILPQWADLRQTYAALKPFALMTLLTYALDKFDFNIIEAYLPKDAVGQYGGLIRIYLSLQAIVPALALAFGSEMLSTKDDASFKRQGEAALLVLAFSMLPLTFGSWFVAPSLLTLIYDQSFARLSLEFFLMCLALLPYSLFIVYGHHALVTRGKASQVVIAMALGLTAGIACGIALVADFGIIGGAIAVLVAKTVAALAVWWSGRHLIALRRVVVQAAPAALATLTMVLVLAIGQWDDPLRLIAYGGLSYAAAVFAFGSKPLLAAWRGRGAP